ncbi:MAG: hypothetical protein LBH01_02095 [Verrucomicrobiales bacterium]|jgi:hypothetical protein|nr:hypothetical protein [Verrucomicrobiales bacterium]
MDCLKRLRELSEKIDLGKAWKPEPPVFPANPKPRIDYPNMYIYDREGLENFPRAGKAVIDYKIERFSTTDRDGKILNDLTLQIKSIEPFKDKEDKLAHKVTNGDRAKPLAVNFAYAVQGQVPESPLSIRLRKKAKPAGIAAIGGKNGKALERLHVISRLLDDRIRNPQGQFVANQGGGADPNSMNAAYRKKKSPLLRGTSISGAAAGLAAGQLVGGGIARVQGTGERLAQRAAEIAAS